MITNKTCAKPECSSPARVSSTGRGPPFVGDLCESCYQERQNELSAEGNAADTRRQR
jgi:hypothetical protein